MKLKEQPVTPHCVKHGVRLCGHTLTCVDIHSRSDKQTSHCVAGLSIVNFEYHIFKPFSGILLRKKILRLIEVFRV